MQALRTFLSSGKAALLLTITEVGMLLYWVFATLVFFKLISVDPALMYSDYQNEIIVAWNWSFFPIDVLFAILGLLSRYVFKATQTKQVASIVSLSLMFCAGLMAISFWIFNQSFDLFWWAINIWLMVLSSIFLINYFTADAEVPI